MRPTRAAPDERQPALALADRGDALGQRLDAMAVEGLDDRDRLLEEVFGEGHAALS